MSFALMAKAMQIKAGSSARKLVLLKLADNANDNGECVPSYQYIADQCEMSRRSVISHVEALIEMGLLVKIERLGGEKRNRSNKYILRLDGENSALGGENSAPPNGEKFALGGETVSPLSGENSAPRTYHSFEPIKEPIHAAPESGAGVERKKTSSSKFGLADLLADNPHGVSEQTLSDWVALRERLKAPISKTVWSRIQSELAKCAQVGVSPDDALAEAVTSGWKGFRFDWVINRFQRSGASSHGASADHCSRCGRHRNDPACMCWAHDIDKDIF